MVHRVLDEARANYCDTLLTKLILNEKTYDDTIDSNLKIRGYFANMIKNTDNVLLVYEENEVIKGYIFLKETVHNNLNGYIIDGLYVEDIYRNKGIATSLIKYSFELTKEKNYKFIDINVLANNEIAIKLYNELGFGEFAKKMRVYL